MHSCVWSAEIFVQQLSEDPIRTGRGWCSRATLGCRESEVIGTGSGGGDASDQQARGGARAVADAGGVREMRCDAMW